MLHSNYLSKFPHKRILELCHQHLTENKDKIKAKYENVMWLLLIKV